MLPDTSEELVSLDRDFPTSESNGSAATALNSEDEDVAWVLVLSGTRLLDHAGRATGVGVLAGKVEPIKPFSNPIPSARAS